MKSIAAVLLIIAGLGWYYVGYAFAPYSPPPETSMHGAGSIARFVGVALVLIGVVSFVVDLMRKPPAPPSP
jgi:hypothetical protein